MRSLNLDVLYVAICTNRGGVRVCVFKVSIRVHAGCERQASKEVIEQREQEFQQFSQMNM